MNVEELLGVLAEKKIQLSLDGITNKLKYSAPKGVLTKDLQDHIVSNKTSLITYFSEKKKEKLSLHRYNCDVFPLSDLQSAYWIGEKNIFQSSTPAYFFEVYETKYFDIESFDTAINKAIHQWDVLRTVVTPDGEQMILKEVSPFTTEYVDISSKTSEDQESEMEEYLSKLALCFNSLEKWPLFTIRVYKVKERYRLIFSSRLIVCDALSWEHIVRSMIPVYFNQEEKPETPAFTFRDYLCTLRDFKNSLEVEKAIDYWRSRIDDFPLAPVLPVNTSELNKPHPFKRRVFRISGQRWKSFKRTSALIGVSENVLLFTAFCEALNKWSQVPRFCINMMYSRRPPIHPEINSIVGNFSSTLLIEVDFSKYTTLKERAQALQVQLLKDMQHGIVSGVEVIRELQKTTNQRDLPIMPVVFANGLNFSSNDKCLKGFEWFGFKSLRSEIHTPQVWLDHQVTQDAEGIVLTWDTKEAYFYNDVIAHIFSAYTDLVMELCEQTDVNKQVHIPLPAIQKKIREEINNTVFEYKTDSLLNEFLRHVDATPDLVAVVDTEQRLTYRLLCKQAEYYAKELQKRGVRQGDKVAIVLDKGHRQLIACLAIFMAGGAYVPIDANWPEDRIDGILDITKVSVVFIDYKQIDDFKNSKYRDQFLPISVKEDLINNPIDYSIPSPDQTAYVIFTSGSTGVPKGVVIAHKAADNTIKDINRRFQIDSSDKVFSVSALNFDLSVYDIFGLLSVGGTIYVPNRQIIETPGKWYDILVKEKVTIWNSVPAFMEMLVEYLEDEPGKVLHDLRVVMLSGDWVPTNLPSRIKRIAPNAAIYALGGATEASIWSNYFKVDDVKEDWNSIPYGYPLSNQKFRVLDSHSDDCPDYVAGELYIAGMGLATEYFGDSEKTSKSFLNINGERLYKTGDWGKYWADGTLEFLGRTDDQVKVLGFRIELGDIDSNLERIDIVDKAVSVFHKGNKENEIISFVKLNDDTDRSIEYVRNQLTKVLPAYMVPGDLIQVHQFDLTSNGKVNRKSLHALYLDNLSEAKEKEETVLPSSHTQKEVAKIWKDILNNSDTNISESFFNAGGNSILAVRLMNRIEKKWDITFSLSDIFQNESIEKIAQLIDRSRESITRKSEELVKLSGEDTKNRKVFFFHPIGGTVLCYYPLVERIKSLCEVYGLQRTPDTENEELSIQELAQRYLKSIREKQPTGPYVLIGWSLGGVLAHEAALQLQKDGEKAYVILIDPWISKKEIVADINDPFLVKWFLEDISFKEIEIERDVLNGQGWNENLDIGVTLLQHRKPEMFAGLSLSLLQGYFKSYVQNYKALIRYTPDEFVLKSIIYEAESQPENSFVNLKPFKSVLNKTEQEHLKITKLKGNHFSVFKEDISSMEEVLYKDISDIFKSGSDFNNEQIVGTQIIGFGPAAIGLIVAADRGHKLSGLLNAGIYFLEQSDSFNDLKDRRFPFQIMSNSVAGHFIAYIRRDGVFTDDVDSEIVRYFEANHQENIPLVKVKDMLNKLSERVIKMFKTKPNSKVLFGTTVKYVQRGDDGYFTTYDKYDQPICKSGNIVLAAGARERSCFSVIQNVSAKTKVYFSEDILKGSLESVAKAIIEGKKIVILGGSHSAFSVLGVLIDQFSVILQPLQIELWAKCIALYYKNYSDFLGERESTINTSVCIDEETGEVNRFNGLRGQSKSLYGEITKGQCPYVKIKMLKDDSEFYEAVNQDTFFIQAIGYSRNEIPVYDHLGNNLLSDNKDKNLEVDAYCRVIGNNNIIIQNAYALGLGHACVSKDGFPRVGINIFHGQDSERIVEGISSEIPVSHK